MTKSLTEHALATIASILDHSELTRTTKKPLPEEKAATLAPAEADGYFKLGPGPMEAIRFKWTVRRADNGDYFVEETIGENSPPIVSGPMPGEEAVKLVDERESDARQRFEQLRHEMAERAAVTDVIHRGDEV